MPQDLSGIWLGVANVRLETKDGKPFSVSVQVHGDKEEPQPLWWPMDSTPDDASDTYRQIAEALDKKRPVATRMRPDGQAGATLKAAEFRIQFMS